MALTEKKVREILSTANVADDKLDAAVKSIMDGHVTSINALREERDGYKTDAETLKTVQKELDELKAAAEKDGKDPYKVKYEALKDDFENYKKEISDKETKATKSEAYKALLKKAGIADKRIDAVLKVSDVDSVELDKNGEIKGADDLLKTIKSEWADFIPTQRTDGANVETPPANDGSKLKTRDEIYKRDESGRFVYDAAQRQAALSQILNSQKG